MKQTLLIDGRNPLSKARARGVIDRLDGVHRVEITRYAPRRTDRQNAWYHGVVTPLAAQALADTIGGEWTAEAAHEFFRDHYLAQPVIDQRTGKTIGRRTGSTAVLSTAEFSSYVAQVRQWLAEYCGTEVPDPDALGVKLNPPAKRKKARAAR